MSAAPILHLSTAHRQPDSRIWYREIKSLLTDFPIVLAGPGELPALTHNFQFLQLPAEKFRLLRFLKSPLRAIRLIHKLRPSLLHFHDPELIPAGWIARLYGIPVIFDMHELTGADIRSKTYLGPFRIFFSMLYQWLEPLLLKPFHLVVAEKSYMKGLQHKGHSCTLVQNFLPEVYQATVPVSAEQSKKLIYLGVMHPNRGIPDLLRVMQELPEDYQLDLIGPDHTGFLQPLLEQVPLSVQNRIRWHGFLPFETARPFLLKAGIGFALIQEPHNQAISYPTKLFEYMGAGLPFIATNWPLYREAGTAGLLVEPGNTAALKTAILQLQEREVHQKCGQKGIELTRDRYHWNTEAIQLKELYRQLLR